MIRAILAGWALVAGVAAHAQPAPIRVIDPVVLPSAHGQRALALRVTGPARITGRAAVILFSHGSGLSRGGYAPIIEAWARAGYIVIQPDHQDASIDGFPPPVAPGADLWRTRVQDMIRAAHAIPAITRAEPAWRGHIDARRVLAAGHSFGGHTVAALMGAGVWDAGAGRFVRLPLPALRGAVLLSPPGDGGPDDLAQGFRARGTYLQVERKGIRGPMLVMVGDADDSRALSLRGLGWHADVYRHSATRGLCLITMAGARHYLGGIVDPRRSGVEDADPARLALVRRASLALFAAALAGRAPMPDDYAPLGTDGATECR
ncbi:prolyl oligopeptidase family serine peptidase [Novosphingobium sp. FSY-8]|uniref:Prolyl oligopeptidase family serine peptidase n=1 Tax=Novosphingobium ovatum TaxID=1908523 RepID=A0ABW9XHW6_9SPHN|nr:prolyl oligopeptidase family serine peptidase [Novosphingobium ovatum]NBC38166.1 prolyl oligopeptidase family serine peptidase [Novosphingobium ovatum]